MTAAITARDVGKGKHWVSRPLPEPPRSRRVSKLAQAPRDSMERLMEEWLSDLTVGNTLDAD